jgi:hypothetical protein
MWHRRVRITTDNLWHSPSTVLTKPIPYAVFSLDKEVLKKHRDVLISRCAPIENKK